MRILVTGAAGYLGSVIVPKLLARGYHVIALDNFLYRNPSLGACCNYAQFELVNGDIRDEGLMRKLVSQADVVIPLAALVGAPLCKADPVGAKTINLDAQLMLLKLLSPQQRVLMPITNSGYGVGDEGKFCTEESPLRPVSDYGKYKVEVEKAMMDRGNAISFRLATVFGMSPRPRLDLLVNDFVYRAYYDRSLVVFEGHFKRNYISIHDVAAVFLRGVQDFDLMADNIYNVGLSSANLSKLALCAAIQEHIPEFWYVESPIGFDEDRRDYIVSNQKLESLGWKPLYSLDDGIRELIRGMPMLKKNQYGNV